MLCEIFMSLSLSGKIETIGLFGHPRYLTGSTVYPVDLSIPIPHNFYTYILIHLTHLFYLNYGVPCKVGSLKNVGRG